MTARVTAVVNQKGGVGKTTTAVALTAAYEDQGHHTLLLDMDPQASASAAVGVDLANDNLVTIYHLMRDYLAGQDNPDAFRAAVQVVCGEYGVPFGVLPAGIELAAAEVSFAGVIRREYILQGLLEAILPEYDEVIIDCPPTLGLLTLNALSAAHQVLIPVVPDYLSARGLGDLLQTLALMRQQRLNPNLRIAGVVLTRVKPSTINYKSVRPLIERGCASAGVPLLPVEIPDTVRAALAAGYGIPLSRDKQANGTMDAYKELARLLLAGRIPTAGGTY